MSISTGIHCESWRDPLCTFTLLSLPLTMHETKHNHVNESL